MTIMGYKMPTARGVRRRKSVARSQKIKDCKHIVDIGEPVRVLRMLW
ncbi:hypothetical protein CI1B_32560 [Bradyrhizobium ivorense]|uniref:Uncharacterized protein n=1 Tax=Bradyrhizobium ivorense TaxID=2511166 RepID=A0A508T5C9_9BRAD|nr:hypothetical protein CI41S_20520 [Bradyrhizobium ivorense]VIO70602.1 hypothetical protein CI1B_32560 [Bradyrhizobium ivorense]